MIIYLFAALSACISAGIILGQQWYVSWHVIWQAALLFAGNFIALSLLFLLVFCISALLVDMKKEQTGRSPYFGFLFRCFIDLAFFFAGVRVHLTGKKRIPKQGNFMLVCNHLSIFDPLVLVGSMPHIPLSFVSKKENYQLPVVRKFLHKLNCLPLDRENDRQALHAIIKAAQLLQREHISMAVFPEGQISKTGTFLPFRNGAFKIAQRANCPIVVTALRNTAAIRKNMFLRPTHVTLDILKVIPAADLQGLATVTIGDAIHEAMAQALHDDG